MTNAAEPADFLTVPLADGRVEDVCLGCARIEAAIAEAPGSVCRAAHDPGWGGAVQVCTRTLGHEGYHRDDRTVGEPQP